MKETSDKLQSESENKMAIESLASQLQSEVKMKVSWAKIYYSCIHVFLLQSDNIAELEVKINTLQSNLVTANTTISSQNEVVYKISNHVEIIL